MILRWKRPLAGDVEVADELLRDRRAALDDLALGQVTPARRARSPRSRRRRAGRSGGPRSRSSAFAIQGLICESGTGCRLLLGRDRAEQRPVGRVDERVLADRDRLERRERAAGLERGGRTQAGEDEHERDPEEDDQHDRDRVPAAVTPAAHAVRRRRAAVGRSSDRSLDCRVTRSSMEPASGSQRARPVDGGGLRMVATFGNGIDPRYSTRAVANPQAQRPAAGEAVLEPVPPGDLVLAEPPAEEHRLAVAERREVDEARVEILDDHPERDDLVDAGRER